MVFTMTGTFPLPPLPKQKSNDYYDKRKTKEKTLMMTMTSVITRLNSSDVDNDYCNGSECQRCWEHVACWTDTTDT